jgi:serine/threonine protein kinase
VIGSNLANYTITGELGAGGMGEVWRAEDTKLSREVIWIDRDGREDVLLRADRRYATPSLSPDGSRLALMVDDEAPDLWLYELEQLAGGTP